MTETVTVDGHAFRLAVDFAARFVADDPGRPVLECIEVGLTETGVWLAATDTYMLGWTWVGAPLSTDPPPVTEAPDSLICVDPDLLRASVKRSDVELSIGDDGRLLVCAGEQSVRIVDGSLGVDPPEWRPLADPDYVLDNKAGVLLDPGKIATVVAAFGGPDFQPHEDEFGDLVYATVTPDPIEFTPPGDRPARFTSVNGRQWALLMGVRDAR